MKHYHICIGIIALFLSSCSFEASWQETEDNILYWAPSHSGRYVWTGNTFYGVANGEGHLNKVNRRGEIKSSTHYYATLGLLNDYDKITLINSWKYWGDEKDGIPHGLGIIERPDSTLVIGRYQKGKSDTVYVFKNNRIIYSGGWKNFAYNGKGILKSWDGHIIYNGRYKDGLYNGNGTLYYDNGQIRYCGHFSRGKYNGRGKLYQQKGKLEYDGHFKDGIYNGYGILYCENDSIVEHVWLNGKINPKYIKLYQNLENHRDKISSTEYLAYKQHLVSYERFAIIWKCFIIGALVLFVHVMIRTYSKRKQVKFLYKQQEPFSKKKMYCVWAVSGIIGVHRIMLSSWLGFINIGLFCIAIICNLTPLTLYAGHYSLIPMFVGWTPTFYIAAVCIGLCFILWIIDSIWVAYRIYYLTSIYYRHDERELAILRGNDTDVNRLMTTISRELPNLLANMQSAISRSRNIGKEKIKHDTWIGRVLKHGEKDLEESKYNRIYSNVYEVQNLQKRLKQYSAELSEYLEEARLNTYRNIYLTKEIITYFRDNVKSKEQVLQRDNVVAIKEMSISTIRAKDVDININAMAAIQTFDASFTAMGSMGLSSGACIGIGAVLAGALLAVDYLEQRNRALEQYARGISKMIENLNSIASETIKVEAKLMRMNELLRALYQCNIAHVKAYVKIRDKAFPKPTFWNFLKGINREDPYFSSAEFKNDMVFLIKVTSEYNKINTAKIID